jgi:diamine N-acetyltransferase
VIAMTETKDAPVVTLREVTPENLDAVLGLAVRDDQKHLVAPNTRSIEQGQAEAEHAWYRVIYADETPVGFTMLYMDAEKADYFLWRLMVDAAHQGRDYGRQAMELVIDFVRQQPNAKELYVSYVPAENNPQPFYSRLGFEETGEEDEGELVMKLVL